MSTTDADALTTTHQTITEQLELVRSGFADGLLGARADRRTQLERLRRMLVEEEDASHAVASTYRDIKERLGIDFVPNLYKVMGANPAYLEANWARVKAIMATEGKLDRLTKEIVAVAVSAVNACDY